MKGIDEFLSPERLDEAKATVEVLLEQSVCVRAMIGVRAIGQRLINIADAVVENELRIGWDVDQVDQQVVLAILQICALESANQKTTSFAQTHRDVMEVALPALRALALQEEL